MAEDLQLPTREDLEQLYHEKGKDALVWYAWRNSLRAISLLGIKPLKYIWPENTIKYAFSVLRIPILLTNYPKIAIRAYTADAAYAASATDLQSSKYAARAADAAYAVATHNGARPTAIGAAMRADKAIYFKNIINNYYIAAGEEAINDFNFLRLCSKFDWLSIPLWRYKPTSISHWERCLLRDLRVLDLDFLANDLEKIFDGISPNNNLTKYVDIISDIIFNDPIALRRAILGEEIEKIQAVRVLLLGSGGAGKSSLADRLQAKPVEYIKPSTQGINYINHSSLKLAEKHPEFKLDTNNLDLYLWDFGGQTIFHGLHSAFLHENCVYVLVVDSRHEQAPDEWLHQIRHLAGNQANVLLVTNEYENCKIQQNQKRLLREFPDLLNDESFFYFSCLTPEPNTFKNFLEKLIEVSSESRRAIFKSTLEINAELSTHYQSEVFLNLDEVQEIIDDKVEVEEYRSSTLTQLVQLGFIVPARWEKYCLNPVWVVDNAYKVLYAEEVINNHGIISLNAIRKLLNCSDKYQAEILVRDLLQERALCCAISKTEYFFPDAASTNEPNKATQVLEHPVLTLRLDIPYLPLGFHARLVHALYQPHETVTIQSTQDIWRQGFILKVLNSQEVKAQAVVHYLQRKSAIEMIFNGEIEYFASLLETFYPELEKALNTSAAQQKIKAQTFVSDDAQNLLSIPSGQQLIEALKRAKTPQAIATELTKMTRENSFNITAGAGSQIIIGNDNHQKAHSNNTTALSTVAATNSTTPSSVTPDTIKAERRQRLLTKLSELWKQHDYETRVEEKLRIKARIDETTQDLASLDH